MGSQVSTDWNRGHKTDRADERADDLDGDDLPSRNRACRTSLVRPESEAVDDCVGVQPDRFVMICERDAVDFMSALGTSDCSELW